MHRDTHFSFAWKQSRGKRRRWKNFYVADFRWSNRNRRQLCGLVSGWVRQRLGFSDTFRDEAGRQAHLAGEVAKQLMAKASELLSEPPSIVKAEILAAEGTGQRPKSGIKRGLCNDLELLRTTVQEEHSHDTCCYERPRG